MSCGNCREAGHECGNAAFHRKHTLHFPFDPREQILSSQAWPIPRRIYVPIPVADASSSGQVTPWLDFMPNAGPQFRGVNRLAAPVLGQECLIGVYHDANGVTPTTYATAILSMQTIQVGAGQQAGTVSARTLEAVDVRPVLSGVNRGYEARVRTSNRFLRFSLDWTTAAISGTTRLMLYLAYDEARFDKDPCPSCGHSPVSPAIPGANPIRRAA